MTVNKNKRILIVDDDKDLRENLAEVLKDAEFSPDLADSGENAVEMLKAETYDLMLLDLIMPGMKGTDVLSEIKKISPKTKVIVITAFATIDSAIEVIKNGASEYVSKPFDVDELLTIIRRVMEEVRFEESLAKLNLDFIMGSLSNSIRRNTIRFINMKGTARFSEILRELDIKDNAKVAFHLKILKESSIVEQDDKKLYFLTKEGKKVLESLKIVENLLSQY